MSCVYPTWKTSILCQGMSITVHLEDRDLVFMRRGKMYVDDRRDWMCDIGPQMLSVRM